jgi:predicted ATPase/DNA-binding winged helix-turn-helix (wHTH) protein
MVAVDGLNVQEVQEDSVSEATIVEFGRFRILPHRRELLADGRSLRIGGRAFDVLMVLIEARGSVVSKDTLMDRVWPDRIVEENNLQAQIAALRNAFGSDRDLIRTVVGRGYQFAGELRVTSPDANHRSIAKVAPPEPTFAPTNLPQPVSDLIGRDEELREVLHLASSHRLVTLTGTGGIGKTRLARAVARQLLPGFADGVWVVELAPVADPGLVPVTVAEAIGLELAAGVVSPERVAIALGDKHLLLVLDNCEHVIDAVAGMAEALLSANPAARVIATSREPLRADGEWIYLVPPLSVPAAEVSNPLQYGAVRLFVARARATEPHFSPDHRAAAIIAAICRRLDGLPLAIELAAARAAALGIEELAARLDDRFHLLTGGRRTALLRHQTLRATLDWSYELLPELERSVLRRLAIFPRSFRLTAASAVAASEDLAARLVVDGLANLVTKSLVAAEIDGALAHYRLLDTTRIYALEKLDQSGEFNSVARRHAEYLRTLFERREADCDTQPTARWLAEHEHLTEDVRAALDWASSPAGDASLGIALTAGAVPLWMYLSLMEECRGRVERALCSLQQSPRPDQRCEMKLHAALAASLMYTRGAVPEIAAAWTRALELAERLGETEYQLRALWGLWSYHISSGQFRAALSIAQKFYTQAAAGSSPSDQAIGDRLIGVSHHYLGDQSRARHHIESTIRRYAPPVHRSHIIRFQTDQLVTARVFLARILWLQGFPDQAMQTVQRNVADARATDHAMSLCYALSAAACPIAFWAGDLTAAEHYVAMLSELSARNALSLWRAWGQSYEGMLAIKRGEIRSGLPLLLAGFAELAAASSSLRHISFLDSLAEAHALAGQLPEAFTAIDDALEWSERARERWRIAELMRIKGEFLLLRDGVDAVAAAEDLFRRSLDWASLQTARAWELRAATSLARLLRSQAREEEAAAILAPVYDRFSEGFETADLKAAKALLDPPHYS